MVDSDALKEALLRLAAGNATDAELEIVQRALQNNQITLATDERAVAVGGNVNDAVIVTGDENVVLVIQNRQLADSLWEALARTKYLEGVIRRYSSITLPIDPAHNFSLQPIFQPLQLRRDPLATENLARKEHQASLGELRYSDKDLRSVLHHNREFRNRVWQAPPMVIAENGDEALKKSSTYSIVVLGGPGMGKTTLLQYLASARAKEALTDPIAPLPIFISLPDLARLDKTLKEYLRSVVQDMMVDERYAQVLWRAIEQGQAFVCLDSLDEVAPRLRSERIRLINEWAASTQSTYVIGSRFTDYKGGQLRRELFSEWELMPLDAEARRTLSQNLTPIMHRLIYMKNEVTEHVGVEQGFVEALQSHPTVAAWGENPLLFSLAQYIFTKHGDLPGSRAELYAEVINALLMPREPDPNQRLGRIQLYSEIALLLFQNNSQVFTLEDLGERMRQALRRLGYQSTPDGVATYVTALVTSGLLDTVAHETYGFRHQTLQEYLVGAALAYWQIAPPHADDDLPGQMMADSIRKLVQKKATRARWSEPLRLMIGELMRRNTSQREDIVQSWLTAFLERSTPEGDPGYLYLALTLRCLSELGDENMIHWSGRQAIHILGNALHQAAIGQRYNLAKRLQGLYHDVGRLSLDLLNQATLHLLTLLADSYVDVKEAAVEALRALGDQLPDAGVMALIGTLEDGDHDLSLVAAQILASLGDRISQERWLAFLAHDRLLVHYAAAQALGALGDRLGQEQWLALLPSSNEYVRRAAVQALGVLGDRLSDAGMTALIEALADSGRDVRQVAAQALGALGDRLSDAGMTALIEALADNNGQVREAVAQSLGILGDRLSGAGMTALIEALADNNGRVKLAATQALAALGDRVGQEQWQAFLANSSVLVRLAIIQKSGLLPTGREMTELRQVLVDSNWEERQIALQILQAVGDRISEEQWQPFLADAGADARRVAVRALGVLGDRLSDAGVMTLIRALNDIHPDVSRVAAQALGGLGERIGLEQWPSVLANSNPDVKLAATQALAALGDRVDQEQWLMFLADSDWRVRQVAAQALGTLGNRLNGAGMTALIEALADDQWPVRQAAALALGGLGDRLSDAGVTALIDTQAKSVPPMKLEATQALAALGNRLSDAGIIALLNTLLMDSSGADVEQVAKQALAMLGDRVGLEQWQPFLANDFYWNRRKTVLLLAELVNQPTSAGVKALLVATMDGDWRVSQTAELAVATLGINEGQWLTFLVDSDWRVRQVAAQALGTLGKRLTNAGVMALIRAEEDSDWRVRQVTAQIVEALGDRPSEVLDDFWNQVGAKQLQALLVDNDWQKRQIGALGLVSLGNRFREMGVMALLKLLAASDWQARKATIRALAVFGYQQKRIVEAIWSWTDDRQWQVVLEDRNWKKRLAAALALGTSGNRMRNAGTMVLVEALANSDSGVRLAAVQRLGLLGKRPMKVEVTDLVDVLADSDAQVKQAAEWGMALLEERLTEVGVTALIGALADSDWQVGHAAALALGGLGNQLTDAGMTALTEAIANSNWLIKPAVAQALGQLGDRLPDAGVTALVAVLADSDSDVRQAVVQALGSLGNRLTDREVMTLIGALKSDNWGERWGAAQVLGQLGDQLPDTGVTALMAALADSDSNVRQAVGRALGSLGNRLTEGEMTTLIEAITDDAWQKSEAALWALATLREHLTEAGETALIRALVNSSDALRQTIARGLGALENRLTDAGVMALIGMLDDFESDVRWQAARVLGTLRDRLTDAHVAVLIEILAKSDWQQGPPAAHVLGALRDHLTDAGKMALIEALASSSDDVQSAAEQALRMLGDQIGQELWLPFLVSGEWRVKQAAARALGTLGSQLTEAGVTALMGALVDNDSDVRKAARQALEKLGNPRTEAGVATLIEALANRYTGQAAAQALSELGDPLTETEVTTLIGILKDSVSDARQAAARALGGLENRLTEEGMTALIGALADSEPRVRQTAAQTLGRLGNRLTEAEVTALIGALADSESDVRQVVVHALQTIHPAMYLIGNVQRAATSFLAGRTPEAILLTLVQTHIAQVIGNMGQVHNQYIQILDKLLDWPHWEVQVTSANALGTLRRGIPDAIIEKLLKKWQVRTPHSVWEAVDDALANILAEDLIGD